MTHVLTPKTRGRLSDQVVTALRAGHVEADAVHEQLAVRQIYAPLVKAEPELLDDTFFGAFTCINLERRLARARLDGWAA